jgi:hypothetical protein
VQPAIARPHALPAVLAAALAALVACERPNPFADLERMRDWACACRDASCTEGAERGLADAIEKRRPHDDSPERMTRAPIIDAARRCLTTAWRASQPRELFSAETDTPPSNAPSTCADAYARAHQILACDRTPVAHRTRVAEELLRLRATLEGEEAKTMSELQLYDHCMVIHMRTIGVENCR